MSLYQLIGFGYNYEMIVASGIFQMFHSECDK